jgi:hypothetical protein
MLRKKMRAQVVWEGKFALPAAYARTCLRSVLRIESVRPLPFFSEQIMRLATFALCVLLFPSTLHSQERLVWKLKEGEEFAIERKFDQKQTVESGGKMLNQEMAGSWLFRFKVVEAKDDGFKLEAILAKATQKTKGAKSELESKIAERMQGTPFKLRIAANGTVSDLEGYDEFLDRAAEKKEDARKVLRVLVPQEAFQQAFDDMFAFLPAEATKLGHKWSRDILDPMPPFGFLLTTCACQDDSEQSGLRVITCKFRTKFQPPTKESNLFRVVKADVNAEEGSATWRFDTARGRLVNAEKSITLKGDMTLDAMGMNTRAEFRSVNTTQIRWFVRE